MADITEEQIEIYKSNLREARKNKRPAAEIAMHREKLRKATLNQPLPSWTAMGSVSEPMAKVFDSINAMGQEKTFKLNSLAKLDLILDDTSVRQTPFFDRKKTSRVSDLIGQYLVDSKKSHEADYASSVINWHKKNARFTNKKQFWNKMKKLSFMDGIIKNYNPSDIAVDFEGGLSQGIYNNGINSMFNKAKEAIPAAKKALEETRASVYNERADLRTKRIRAKKVLGDIQAIREGYIPTLERNIERLLTETGGMDDKIVAMIRGKGDVMAQYQFLTKYTDNRGVKEAIGHFMNIDRGMRNQQNKIASINKRFDALDATLLKAEHEVMYREDTFKGLNEVLAKGKAGNLSDKDRAFFAQHFGKEMASTHGSSGTTKSRLKKHQDKRPGEMKPYEVDKESLKRELAGGAKNKDNKNYMLYKELDEAVSDLSFQTLSPADYDGAVEAITDPTLKTLVENSYGEVTGPNGSSVKRPYDFMGMRSSTYGEGNDAYHIPGYLDIGNEKNPFNHRDGLRYLDRFDARGFIDNVAAQETSADGHSMKVLAEKVSNYRQSQRDMTIEQKQARYKKLNMRNADITEAPIQAVNRIDTPDKLTGRLSRMFKDKSLVEPTPSKNTNRISNRTKGNARVTAKNTRRMSYEKGKLDGLRDSARKRRRSELMHGSPTQRTRPKSSHVLMETIDSLAKQTKFDGLNRRANEFRESVMLFNEFQTSLDNGNLEGIASMIRTSQGDSTVFGTIGQLYNKVAQKANAGRDTFESRPAAAQLEIAQRMSERFVAKLDSQLSSIHSEMLSNLNSPVVSNMYEALSQHQSDVWREFNETEDMYNKGTLVDDPSLAGNGDNNESDNMIKRLEESDAQIEGQRESRQLERLRQSWEDQAEVQEANIGNALSNSDMKEFRAIAATDKNNNMIIAPKDLTAVQGRGELPHFTYSELAKGSVTAGTEEIPINHFKQNYTFNSMREIMGGEWGGFTNEQWDNGAITFGKTTMPISQFAEYYEPKYRKPHIARTNHTTGEKMGVGLSTTERRLYNHYVNQESIYTNEKASIMVPKPLDKDLERMVTNVQESKAKVLMPHNVVPHTVEKVKNNTAVMVADHVLMKDLSFQLSTTDGRNILESLEEAETFLGSSKRYNPGTHEKGQTLEDADIKKKINREIGVTSDGNPITRKMMFDKFIDPKTGLPEVVSSVAKRHFSWVGASESNMLDLGGVAYPATLKAFTDTSEETIIKAFNKYYVTPGQWLELTEQQQRDVVNEAFSHQTKVNTLLGFMENGSEGGDKIDSIIRVAKNISNQKGHAEPTLDNIKEAIFEMNKGIKTYGDKDLKSYYELAEKLVQNDSILRERLSGGGSKPSVSLEVLAERETAINDKYDLRDTASRLAGDGASADDIDNILANLKPTQKANSGVENLSQEAINKMFEREQLTLIDRESDTIFRNINVSKDKLEAALKLKVMKKAKRNRNNTNANIKMITKGVIDEEGAKEALDGIIGRLLNGKGVDPMMKEVILKNKERIIEQTSKYLVGNNVKTQKVVNRLANTINKIGPSQFKAPATPNIKLAALKNLERANPGFAKEYISNNGGLFKTMAEILDISEKDVRKHGTIEKAFSNLTFNSIEDFKNFSVFADIAPNLKLTASYVDNKGNLVTGTLGEYTDADGRTSNIIRTNGGNKVKAVNARSEAVEMFGLNGKTGADLSYAKENVARNHASGEYTNLIAGFSGNYDKITRRPYGGTSGIDAITTIDNLSVFKRRMVNENADSYLFDFETTGLPGKMPEGFEEAFAPIEMSGTTLNKMDDLKVKKGDVESIYARPNKKVLELFDIAQGRNDYNITNVAADTPQVFGVDDAEFMLMRNYAKYDTSRIELDGKRYTVGSLLTAKMTLNDEGMVISHMGDNAVNTMMTHQEIVERTKQSSKKVVDYLSTATSKSKKKFGIDPANIYSEFKFMDEFAQVSKDYDNLIGHNISTADIPWAKMWADRNNIVLDKNIDTKLIDTQDLLQASNSGRRYNNLESFSKNKSKSHLAWADVITNADLLKKMMKDKTINQLVNEVENGGIKKGHYLMKNNAKHMGLMDIPDGFYRFESYGKMKDGRGYLTVTDMNQKVKDGEVLKSQTFFSDNLAILRKEMADNWSNLGEDLEIGRAINEARIRESAVRTMDNSYINGMIDRYHHYAKQGDFDIQRNLVRELKGMYDTEYVDDGRLSSGGNEDLQRFIYSNKSKLSDEGYARELTKLNNISKHRTPEFEKLGEYLDSGEGKIVKRMLREADVRKEAGLYSPNTRELYGREIQQGIKEIKEKAIKDGKLSSEYMIDIPDRFKVGELGLDDLSASMREKLRNISPWISDTKQLHMTFDSAEQIKGDIFKMGESLARKIVGMEGAETLEQARSKVTNEVIMPMLAPLSKDKKLKQAIADRKNGIETDDYKSTVYTLSSELAGRREEMKKKFKPAQVVDMTKPLDLTNKEHRGVMAEMVSMMRSTMGEYDQEVMSYPNPDINAEMKTLPIPGSMEKLNDVVNVQKANRKALFEALKKTETYKNNQAAIDLLGADIFSLPGWNMSALNSGGMSRYANLGPIEFRETNNVDNQWMQFKTADQLKGYADSIRTSDNENTLNNVMSAFLAKDKNAMAYHRKYNQDIIEFAESKLNGSLSNDDFIRRLNEGHIQHISKTYGHELGGLVSGNNSQKASIIRELWTRASMKDEALTSNIVTPHMIENNPTKYNAMKAIGMLQKMGEGDNWYTGQIGLPGQFSNTGDKLTLDPSRILVPGNKEGYVNTSTRKGVRAFVNGLSGRPLTSLATDELDLVVNNDKAPYNTEAFKSYHNGVSKIQNYNEKAHLEADGLKRANRNLPKQSSHAVIPEATQHLSSIDHVGHLNQQTIEDGMYRTGPSKIDEAIDINKTTTKSFLDKDGLGVMKDGLEKVKKVLSEHKKGAMIGGVALAVLGGLALTSKRGSSGKTPEQQPVANQAPNVDGTYDKEYNKHENSNEHFIPNNKYMQKTIHLEEGGRGLNVRAKGVNRQGLEDDTFDKAITDTMGSTLSANVNINHSDNRASIDNNYVQGLVSSALFG